MTSTRRRFAAAALATFALVLGSVLVASPASAAGFDVTDPGDDATTPGTLRWALTQAEATPGLDTITITYEGAIPAGASALPVINDDVTIVGPGSDKLTVSALGSAFKLGTPVTVAISGMTIKADQDAVNSTVGGSLTLADIDATGTAEFAVWYAGGSAADAVSLTGVTMAGSTGDAFWVEMTDGTVSLHDVTATGNTGSGITLGALGAAQVTASDLVANGNSDLGVWLSAAGTSTIAIDGLEATGNTTSGILIDWIAPDAEIDLRHATISENGETGLATSQTTGVEGTLAVRDSVVSGNGDDADIAVVGGGIALFLSDGARATVETTTVSGNGGFGGGITLIQQGASDVTLTSSTLSGNIGLLGGGLLAFGESAGGTSTIDIANSTVSGNSGLGGGMAIVNVDEGPGGVELTIANSTILANASEPSEGAGVVVVNATVLIANSILAGDTGASDLLSDESTVTIHHSLVQVPDSSADAALAAGTGNLTGIDPDLGPLADNGGPTMTHLPGDASPVLGAGDPAFTGLATDQRGQTRVVGILDMGSVELGARLAATGADAATPVTGGLLLLGAGLLFLVARRRATARVRSAD